MKETFAIPAGKVREYENIFDALRREVWDETRPLCSLRIA